MTKHEIAASLRNLAERNDDGAHGDPVISKRLVELADEVMKFEDYSILKARVERLKNEATELTAQRDIAIRHEIELRQSVDNPELVDLFPDSIIEVAPGSKVTVIVSEGSSVLVRSAKE